MPAVRLDKYIAENTPYSRTDAKRLIKQRRIRLGDELALSASQKIDDAIAVYIDGHIVEPVGLMYLMMHKPQGYVCATEDAEHPTVMDIVSERSRFIGSDSNYQRIRAAKLQIVGRLDRDTTGLLLLTNDGDWNHRISSPRHDCDKSYVAELDATLNENICAQFAEGIRLRNEDKATLPAKLEILSSKRARVTIREGRYHQVKRMFAACGNKVVKLHRERIGKLTLDDSLAQGNFRLLSADETV